MRRKLFIFLLGLFICLGLTAAVSAADEEGSSTVKITVTELKPGYYIGAIWDANELLTLFDYTVDKTGKLETTVDLGKTLPLNHEVKVGISGENADEEPKTLTVTPDLLGDSDKPDKPDTPDNPDKPDKPGTPDNSNKPDKPGTPDNSNKPDKPGTPDNLDKPDKPGTSGGSGSGGSSGGGSSGTRKPAAPETNTPAPTVPSSPKRFTDVPTDAYYYDAVMWASANGITTGTGGKKFQPDAPCTRAQIVTFLWRAAGSPNTEETTRFTDIPSDFYARDAVQWAVSEGITKGMGKKTFRPAQPCTRAQAVTFLHRAAGVPAETHTSRFTDVPAESYYADAVQWAVNNQITKGMGAKRFQPDTPCTRAQIVTFLYRNQQ